MFSVCKQHGLSRCGWGLHLLCPAPASLSKFAPFTASPQDVILRGGKALPLYARVVEAGVPRAIVLPAVPGGQLKVRSVVFVKSSTAHGLEPSCLVQRWRPPGICLPVPACSPQGLVQV